MHENNYVLDLSSTLYKVLHLQLPRTRYLKNILLSYTQPHIHALRIKRHNEAVWELQKLITQHN
jgi:hypothetical protein